MVSPLNMLDVQLQTNGTGHRESSIRIKAYKLWMVQMCISVVRFVVSSGNHTKKRETTNSRSSGGLLACMSQATNHTRPRSDTYNSKITVCTADGYTPMLLD